MDAVRAEGEMTSQANGRPPTGTGAIEGTVENIGGQAGRQREITSLMCGAALSILRFHFPECRVLQATPEPTALAAEIVTRTGETHYLRLPLDPREPDRAMLGALAQLEGHIQLLVGRMGPSILALGQRYVGGPKTDNVIHLVKPARERQVAVLDVEALCGLLAGKFGQMAELFADLRASGHIDPAVLAVIATRTEALAAATVAVATRQTSPHSVSVASTDDMPQND